MIFKIFESKYFQCLSIVFEFSLKYMQGYSCKNCEELNKNQFLCKIYNLAKVVKKELQI